MDHEKLKSLPTNVLIGSYLDLRDKKQTIEKTTKENLRPYNTGMEAINKVLTERLQDEGTESMRTEAGTVYKSERRSVKVENWNETLEWLKDGSLWHMLDKRLNKTAVETFFEEHGELPPGVSIAREFRVNIRIK